MINLEIIERGRYALLSTQACGKTFLEFESEGTGRNKSDLLFRYGERMTFFLMADM